MCIPTIVSSGCGVKVLVIRTPTRESMLRLKDLILSKSLDAGYPCAIIDRKLS